MAKTSSPASTLLEREGKSRMWLRLIWQLRELLPLLGRMLPLLEGWVAGNSGASAATSRALEKLESRVASAVGGVNSTQEEMGRQIREQGLVLQQLTSDMKHMRALVEREAMEREVLREDLARMERWTKAVSIGVGLCAVLLAGVLLVLAVHFRK